MFFIRIYFIIVWQGGLQIACQNKGKEQKGQNTTRPARAKALLTARYFKAFALTGRLADCYYTQGDALG